MKYFAVIVALLVGASCVRAQQGPDDGAQAISPFHLGLRGGYLQNYHKTNANIFVGCPECGTFQNGKGSGFDLGIIGELPLRFYPRLELTFSAGYAQRGGAFGEASTSLNTILDPTTGKYISFDRQNDFSAGLGYIDLHAGLRIKPLARFPAYFETEIVGGLPLGQSTSYVQTETIISPSHVLYPDTHSTSRSVGNGKISDIHTAFGALATIGYEIPFGPFLTAAPEISYYYPLTNVTSQFNWKVSSVRAGVAIRYNFVRPFIPPPIKAEERPIVERPKVAKPEAPQLQMRSLASAPLSIVETIVTETFPLLPYIFFDSASSVLPERFVRTSAANRASFRESNLPHRALGSYYEILNVIGSRMAAYPQAMLTINGTTDGKESTSGAEALALARANVVRDYLHDVWAIDGARLIVKSSASPHNPSSTEYAEGYEENRRVELSSKSPEILRPIVHERFREETATPSSLPVALTEQSSFASRDWRLDVSVAGRDVYQTSGAGAPPSSVQWKPAAVQLDSIGKHVQNADSLEWTYSVTSMNGQTASQQIRTPVSKAINPFELSRLSLIVFDFDQSDISAQNNQMIAGFVAKSLYPASTLTITGSTDNLGELKHNQELSEARANHVRELILAEKPTANITSTKGIGPSNQLYDNSLPEGRYYCRTVKVEVETPLESVVR